MYGNTNDTVQPTLNLKELKRLVFNIPEKNEQDEIAEVLSSLDDKIDLLHRQNQTLEQMAETLFRQWFVQRKGLNYDSDDFHDDPDSKNHENQAHHKNQGSDNEEADERSEEVSLYDAIELIGGGTPKTSVE